MSTDYGTGKKGDEPPASIDRALLEQFLAQLRTVVQQPPPAEPPKDFQTALARYREIRRTLEHLPQAQPPATAAR